MRNRRHSHAALRTMLATAPLALALHAHAAPSLAWKACPASLVGDTWPDLGDRLRCARVSMPLDHDRPDHGRIDVGVVRIAAGVPARREGSLFINVGGPGAQPAAFVASMASAFSGIDARDPLHGGKRELADRLDFVAVIPRGLAGGWEYDCVPKSPGTHAFLPTHRDDANWALAVAGAEHIARACSTPAQSAYVSTWQHVKDMDAVREAIGDERIHFHGVSYGGKVGAWYAAMYPRHLDRLVLDSSFYFPGTFSDAMYLTMDAENARFETDVLPPLLRDPERWGQPNDPDALRWALRDLSPELRFAWYDALVDTADVAAALSMDRRVKANGWTDWARLRKEITGAAFSTDPAVDRRIRHAAWGLLERGRLLGVSSAPPRSQVGPHADMVGPLGEAVYQAVLCNDDYWRRSHAQIRAQMDRDAYEYPFSDGSQAMFQLTCAAWPHPQAPVPDLAPLEARPFVLVQAEHDAATPARGARALARRFTGARLLMVRGTGRHGLLGRSATPCVERDTVRYLLDGTLPMANAGEQSCDFVAEEPDGEHGPAYELEGLGR